LLKNSKILVIKIIRKDEQDMPKFTFAGGVHPHEGKDLSKDKKKRTSRQVR